jgi:hypothetical protein
VANALVGPPLAVGGAALSLGSDYFLLAAIGLAGRGGRGRADGRFTGHRGRIGQLQLGSAPDLIAVLAALALVGAAGAALVHFRTRASR